MTWIFGYGSLIWKANFKYSEKRSGFIKGFHRRFWQGSHDHRGTPSNPGRVVTLIPHDEWIEKFSVDDLKSEPIVWGMAYYVDDSNKNEVFEYLDFREKNGYELTMVQVHTTQGILDCHLYVASTTNEAFLGPQPLNVIAEQIRTTVGPSGPNLEYLLNLHKAHAVLTKEKDEHLDTLVDLITKTPN